MIKTTKMLLDELSNYKNPYNKISRLVKNGEIIQVTKCVYETNRNLDGKCLACIIYGPSYLSFEYALSYHGMIPEAVYTYTSATCEKHKRKQYTNYFGDYTYRDVPKAVFSLGLDMHDLNGYLCLIATKEKALCDMLYAINPVSSQKKLKKLLFDDLRIDENIFSGLNKKDITIYAKKYKNTNIKLLAKFLGE